MTYTITRENAEKDLEALQAILDNDGIVDGDIAVLEQIVKTIKGQIPKKPVIEEPELSFSVINARPPYADTVTTLTKLGDHWVDLDGNGVGPFADLAEVEVLRVGIGEPEGAVSDRASVSTSSRGEQVKAAIQEAEALQRAMPGPDEAYAQGWDACLQKLRERFIQLASSAITSERKDAWRQAIEALEAFS